MRLVIIWAATLIPCGVLFAMPPVSGVILTGSDSSLHVFWYHPRLHAYEQGVDRGAPESNLVPTDIPGQYTIAQKSSFSYMSFITRYRIKVNPEDVHPGLPGDQFSPFGYSVYFSDDDSLPLQPAALTGSNRLCGGVFCDSQWVDNTVGLLNIEGGEMWFGMDWADSTPAAPQIKCSVLDEPELRNLAGIMNGGAYAWIDIMYSPIYRNRFLSPFGVDTTVPYGWRRPIISDMRPDSFRICCYRPGGGDRLSQYTCGVDSLYLRLPFTDIDSIEIFACHDDRLEGSSLVLIFDRDRAMPIKAAAEYRQDGSPFEFDLIVDNLGREDLELTLGFDRARMEGPDRRIRLDGLGTVAIPFRGVISPSDSMEAMIVFRDRSGRYQPYLAAVPYPPPAHTDVDDRGQDQLPVSIGAYPNPCREKLIISIELPTRGVEVEIYNVTGQLVARMNAPAGGDIVWEARDSRGERSPAGIYFVRVQGLKGGAVTRKIVLLR